MRGKHIVRKDRTPTTQQIHFLGPCAKPISIHREKCMMNMNLQEGVEVIGMMHGYMVHSYIVHMVYKEVGYCFANYIR